MKPLLHAAPPNLLLIVRGNDEAPPPSSSPPPPAFYGIKCLCNVVSLVTLTMALSGISMTKRPREKDLGSLPRLMNRLVSTSTASRTGWARL